MKTLILAAFFAFAPLAAHAADCSPSKPEPFGVFLQRFSVEPAFATQRTVLPLQNLRWEYGLNEQGQDDSAPVKSLITKSEYSKWPTLSAYIKDNHLAMRVKSQTRTTAMVDVFKEDTDWLSVYHFKSRNGCWFFWQFEDQSL